MNKINQIKQAYEANIGKIKFAPRCCFSMCLVVARKMGKISNDLYLVESTGHYWLEDSEGTVYDPYTYYNGDTYNYSTQENIRRVRIADIRANIYRSEWTWGGVNESERVSVFRINNYNNINWE